jgi:hypothetical protein
MGTKDGPPESGTAVAGELGAGKGTSVGAGLPPW